MSLPENGSKVLLRLSVAGKSTALLPVWLVSKLFKVRPVQFGALPAAAQQLLTKPRSRPKIQNSYEPGGLVNSLVSGTPRI